MHFELTDDSTGSLEYPQSTFPFISEERPTGDGCPRFVLPPAALDLALKSIAMPGLSGSEAAVELSLFPRRLYLRVDREGLAVETDLQLGEFANLPSNGVAFSVQYARLAQLMHSSASEKSHGATFLYASESGRSRGYLNFRHGSSDIWLAAERRDVTLPMPSLAERPLHPPAVARALARALKRVTIFPPSSYAGPVMVHGGLARSYSRRGVLEYTDPSLGLSVHVPVTCAADLSAILSRAKLGLHTAEFANSTAFSDGLVRYAVAKPADEIPPYEEAKAQAIKGHALKSDRQKLADNLALIDAATAVRGMPGTIHVVANKAGDVHIAEFTVQQPKARGTYRARAVGSEWRPGEIGELPVKALLQLVSLPEFGEAELRFGQRAGALVLLGEAATLRWIFPYRAAGEADMQLAPASAISGAAGADVHAS